MWDHYGNWIKGSNGIIIANGVCAAVEMYCCKSSPIIFVLYLLCRLLPTCTACEYQVSMGVGGGQRKGIWRSAACNASDGAQQYKLVIAAQSHTCRCNVNTLLLLPRKPAWNCMVWMETEDSDEEQAEGKRSRDRGPLQYHVSLSISFMHHKFPCLCSPKLYTELLRFTAPGDVDYQLIGEAIRNSHNAVIYSADSDMLVRLAGYIMLLKATLTTADVYVDEWDHHAFAQHYLGPPGLCAALLGTEPT